MTLSRFGARLILLAWLLGALYIGAAGWARMELEEAIQLSAAPSGAVDCGGIEFASSAACEQYRRNLELERLFPWIINLPKLLGSVLLALGFGAVGGVMRALTEEHFRDRRLDVLRAVDLPLFGALIGILVLGVIYLVPAAVTVSSAPLRPSSLIFVTILAGTFSVQVFGWIERRVSAVFPESKSTNKKE